MKRSNQFHLADLSASATAALKEHENLGCREDDLEMDEIRDLPPSVLGTNHQIEILSAKSSYQKQLVLLLTQQRVQALRISSI